MLSVGFVGGLPSFAQDTGHWVEGEAIVYYTSSPSTGASPGALQGGSIAGTEVSIVLGSLGTFPDAAHGVAKSIWVRSSPFLMSDPYVMARAEAERRVTYTRVADAPDQPWNFDVTARWKWDTSQATDIGGVVSFGNYTVTEPTGDNAFIEPHTPNYGDTTYTLTGTLYVLAYGRSWYSFDSTTDAYRVWHIIN